MASSDIFRAPMPTVIYGTARKGTDSGDLVYQAIKAGFRGIDSGVGEHYNEASVGKGLQRAYEDKIIERSDLYIQTKVSLSDPRYLDDPDTLGVKISKSVRTSGWDLNPTNFQGCPIAPQDQNKYPYIDSVLLDRPGTTISGTIAVITVLKRKVEEGEIGSFGICNVSVECLKDLLDHAPHLIRPAVIQNPFTRYNGFDVKTRWLCHSTTDSHIDYQAFYTLRGNSSLLQNATYVLRIANQAQVSNLAAWFSLLISTNIVVLTSPRQPHQMRENIDHIEKVKVWRDSSDKAREEWVKCRKAFLGAINGGYDFEGSTRCTETRYVN